MNFRGVLRDDCRTLPRYDSTSSCSSPRRSEMVHHATLLLPVRRLKVTQVLILRWIPFGNGWELSSGIDIPRVATNVSFHLASSPWGAGNNSILHSIYRGKSCRKLATFHATKLIKHTTLPLMTSGAPEPQSAWNSLFRNHVMRPDLIAILFMVEFWF